MNVHLGLSEDITIGVVYTKLVSQGTITTSATKYIACHMTIEQFHFRFTCLKDTCQVALVINIRVVLIHSTTSYGCNLTTTEEVATNPPAIHLGYCMIHRTTFIVTTTEGVTTLLQTTGLFTLMISWVIHNGHITLVNLWGCVVIAYILIRIGHVATIPHTQCGFLLIQVAYITIIDRQVRCTKYGTSLTTTINTALNGRNTIEVIGTIQITNHDIGDARSFIKFVIGHLNLLIGICHTFSRIFGGETITYLRKICRSHRQFFTHTHATLIATTIDITC